MKEPKVYTAIKELGATEISGFRKFLNSPYFNQDKRLVHLYDFYIDNRERADIVETVILQEYEYCKSPKELRHLNSYLSNHLINFFAQQELKSDKLIHNTLKFKGLSRKDTLKQLLASTEKRNLTYLERYKDNSAEYHLARFMHEKLVFDKLSDHEKKRLKSKVSESINIDIISNELDQFYIIEKLKLYINLLSWKRSYKIDKEVEHIDEIKQILNKSSDKNAEITAYLLVVHSLEEPDKTVYYELLKKHLDIHHDEFSYTDFKFLTDSLISYGIAKINKGDSSFISKTLETYENALESSRLESESFITPISFNNIVLMGLRLDRYDWVEKFVNKYIYALPENHRQNAFQFSLARIEYYKKNYAKVVQTLQKIEYEMVMYNLNSKMMLLGSYYELQEYDALDSLINAFKVYLNREKSISASRKKGYTQFMSYLKKIAYINPRDKKKLKTLKERLEGSTGVLNKKLLLEKIEELEGVNSREQLRANQ